MDLQSVVGSSPFRLEQKLKILCFPGFFPVIKGVHATGSAQAEGGLSFLRAPCLVTVEMLTGHQSID